MSSDLEKNGDPGDEAGQPESGNGISSGLPDHARQAEAAAPADAVAKGAPEAPAPGPAARQPSQGRGPVRRFVRSLISHVVFAGIVTAGVVGLLYQREIFNKLGDELCTEDRLGGFMTKALRPAALPAAESAKALPAASAASPAPAPPVPVTAPPEQPPKAAKPEVQEAAPAQASAQPAANPAPAQREAANPAEEAVATPALPQAPAPIQVEQPSGAPSSSAPPASRAAAAPAGTPEAADGMESGWQAARQAAATHRADAADLYRSLVIRYPGVAALRGEFGNVLYGMGRMKEAAEQYYEVAMLQLKGPQPELAACLGDIIERIDPGRAEMLRPQIVRPCPHNAK
jgi:outer membrane biosynthesis protein TonB